MYLDIDVHGRIQLKLTDIPGKHIAVLGLSGSGKSNTVTVLAEELLTNNYPLTIVDVDSEYWGLKEVHNIPVVGKSPNVDLEVSPLAGAALANWVFDKNIPIILDVLNFDQEQREQFLTDYLRTFWNRICLQKRPHLVIVDEAHLLVPQQQKGSELKKLITRMALQGRKRGLGVLIASQRPSMVDKNIITQAGFLLLHRNTYPNEIKIYQEIIPLPADQIKKTVPEMQPGQIIALLNHKPVTTTIRKRHTFDGGATPTLVEEMQVPDLKGMSAELLEELRRVTVKEDHADATTQTIKALQQENANLKAEVAHLKELLETARAQQPISVDKAQAELELQEGLKARQRQAFKKLLAELKNASLIDKSALAFLINSNKSYQIREIAPHIAQNPDTLAKNPPHKFLGRFILREQKNGGRTFYYYFNPHYLPKAFPNLDVEAMNSEVVAIVSKALGKVG